MSSFGILSNYNRSVILKHMYIDDPIINKRKYSHEYILDNLLHILKDVTCWRSLSIFLVKEGKSKNHWSTIIKRHHLFAKLQTFKKAYKEILINYHSKMKNPLDSLKLYIDGSLITNIGGIDMIGRGENKKKNNTKMTVLCDDNKNVYDINLYSGFGRPEILRIMFMMLIHLFLQLTT